MNSEKLKKTALHVGMVLLAVAVLVMVAVDAGHKKYDFVDRSSIAMGTVVSQKLYVSDGGKKELAGVEKTIDKVEKAISWRLEGSYAFELNRKGKIAVEGEYNELFASCKELYEKTDGAFDITVGRLSRTWNIGEESACIPPKKNIKEALKLVDGSKLKVSETKVKVGEGQYVDLGSVGKGLACDKVRAYLEGTDVHGAVVSVGGSVLLYGTNPNASKWTVAIRDPRGEINEHMGTIQVPSGCVSTSGDYEKYLDIGGRRYHHLLDPKTGYPAESGLMSVTVVCDSGFLSDALSTACFVLGREKGLELLEEYGAQGVFIDNDFGVYITSGLRSGFTLTDTDFTVVS